ncbi:putative zinc-binding peptidase [soil metagenome]
MKVFHCDHCGQLLFFENFHCVHCKHLLAYVPELGVVTSLDPVENDLWTSPLPRAQGKTYRLCENYKLHNTCNWAMPSEDPNLLCKSCRLTRTIPNLEVHENAVLWYKLGIAKRRLIYTLQQLNLPIKSKAEDPEHGLVFDFLSDQLSLSPVLTGHDNGTIVMNIIEADEVEREKRRVSMHEPYRTLLGHFRHEIGHYYWDVLIQNSPRLDAFRELFGDERVEYDKALKKHYEQGPPPNWQENFVSAYASSHAWEDWAETWAHYLHVTDTLETAADSGIHLRPKRSDEPALNEVVNPIDDTNISFDKMMDAWVPLTYVLNNLNRGLGMSDAYPFVLSESAMKKLRFIHETIEAIGKIQPTQAGAPVPGNQPAPPQFADAAPAMSSN